MDFFDVKAGDRVVRLIGGRIPMMLVVSRVDEHLIHTAGGWTFRRDTGGEVDDLVGWDGLRVTGSTLWRAS